MTYIPSWGPDSAATMPLKTFPAELGIIWLAFRMSLEFDQTKKKLKIHFFGPHKKLYYLKFRRNYFPCLQRAREVSNGEVYGTMNLGGFRFIELFLMDVVLFVGFFFYVLPGMEF
jgi:hypothetical protein